MLRFFVLLFSAILLSGCVPPRYVVAFQEPSFDLSALQKEPVVVVGAPAFVTLYNFQRTFGKVYQTNENFMGSMVNSITARLKASGWNVVADNSAGVYERFQNDSAKFISPNHARFLICIRTASVDQLNRTSVMPNPAGMGVMVHSERLCKVALEVVIMDCDTRKMLMSVAANNRASVFLWDYQGTLLRAVAKTENVLVKNLLGARK